MARLDDVELPALVTVSGRKHRHHGSFRARSAVLPMYRSEHNSNLFAADFTGGKSRTLRWKPNDPSSCVRCDVGEGAAVTGINDLRQSCPLSISPSGEMFVSDPDNRRLLRFENGSGHLVVSNTDAEALFCSPNGVLYVAGQGGATVQKLVGSTLETMLASESLPADMQFAAYRI